MSGGALDIGACMCCCAGKATGRASNLRDNRVRLKAGSDEALFVFA